MKNFIPLILFSFLSFTLMSQNNPTDLQKEIQGVNSKVTKLQTSVTGNKNKLNGILETNKILKIQVDSLKAVVETGTKMIKAATDSISAKSALITLSGKRVNDLSEALAKRKTYTIIGGAVILLIMLAISIFAVMIRRKVNELDELQAVNSGKLDASILQQKEVTEGLIKNQADSTNEMTRVLSVLQNEIHVIENQLEKSITSLRIDNSETEKNAKQEIAGLKAAIDVQLKTLTSEISALSKTVISLQKPGGASREKEN